MRKNQKATETGLPCPSAECGSSDAYAIYEDGHGYCFSCSKRFKGHNTQPQLAPTPREGTEFLGDVTFQVVPWRGLTRSTMEFFGIKTAVREDGKPLHILCPYPLGQKGREVEEKKFFSKGDMSTPQLFGSDKFSAGSAKAITIYEGVLDAPSGYQMMGSKYPSVAVRSSSSAKEDCAANYEYLNSFEKIYLCFDNDPQGEKASKKVASLFDYNKVHVVKLTKKDANEYLQAGEEKQFVSIWHNSQRYLPEGISCSFSEFGEILKKKDSEAVATFPFPSLQAATYGIRPGEVYLVTGLEGIGKTTLLRSLEHHILKTTDINVGVIHLEEPKSMVLKGLATLELGSPVHLPDSPYDVEAILNAVKALCRRDGRLHIYSHFGTDDPDIFLEKLRFLFSVAECRVVLFDHITMLATGAKDRDEREVLDYLTTEMNKMVIDRNGALVMISHVNDEGLTRGSRYISKCAKTWIHLTREKTASTEAERNVGQVTLNKNFFGSTTGPCGKLLFNKDTFKITELTGKEFELPPLTGFNADG